ncbi:TPA: hypothetical protein N0F65_008922 [Lagenidium giganteum]|uniref:ABC transporter domain-containing protein n=1 Tax=Lagenidium giganteum TaxID=4803 RepID=A0AAV2YT65_9STRA|nr:TPA: hypothetical protein N0F65_008922 [Lagenidium giganteum]
MPTAGKDEYGTIAPPAAEAPSPLLLQSTSVAAHPERTCSWSSWLFVLFHEELFHQNRPPPAPWRRLFTRHSPRIPSIDHVLPLPLEWQCAAAKREFRAALIATHGDVIAAVLRIERFEVWRGNAWSLASGLLYVAHAALLMELLRAVTSAGHGVDTMRMTSLVLGTVAAHVGEVVAYQHRSLSFLHVNIRVICGLLLLIMERSVRIPWAQLVGEDSDVPPGVYIRGLHMQVDRICMTIERTRDSVGDVVKLTANDFLLERYVGHHASSFAVIAAMFWSACTSVHARVRWRVWQPLETAHADTVPALNEFFKWAFPVKLYAWEKQMLKRILDLRAVEERARKASQMHAMASHLAGTTNCLTVVVVLLLLSLQHVTLTADRVIAVAMFVQPINLNFQSLLSRILASPHDDALSEFLASTKHAATQEGPVDESASKAINDQVTVKNAVVCAKQRPLFVNVSIEIKRGELAIVYGPAGAGKTTILRVLAGEITPSSGSVFIPATWCVAYCAQEHWLQTGTIRENILLGSPFDQAKYLRVLDACGLLDDLDRFADGDGTYIGSRGASLSGGQKARVALARACYADADLYLLDCTLDCVDPLVQQEVFANCICNLLRHKTIVMVTQNPELASTSWADRRLDVRAASIVETVRKKQQGRDRSSMRSARVPSRQLKCHEPAGTKASLPVNLRSHRNDVTQAPDDVESPHESPQNHSVWGMVKILSRSNIAIAQFGLLLVVLSGIAIVREAWLCFGIVDNNGGVALVVYTGVVLGLQISLSASTWVALHSLAKYSGDKFRRLVTGMTRASLRFFDDVQHGELSYRVWGDLFHLEQHWFWSFHVTMKGITEMASRIALMVWTGGGAAAAFLVPVIADWWYLVNDVTSRDQALIIGKQRVQHEDWLLEISGGLPCIRLLGKSKQDAILQQYSE